MQLYYIILVESYHKGSDLWDVLQVDESTSKELEACISNGISRQELEDRVGELDYIDQLAEDVSKDEAWQCATEFADSHIITLIMDIPFV